jgi:hypothetical protein
LLSPVSVMLPGYHHVIECCGCMDTILS